MFWRGVGGLVRGLCRCWLGVGGGWLVRVGFGVVVVGVGCLPPVMRATSFLSVMVFFLFFVVWWFGYMVSWGFAIDH